MDSLLRAFNGDIQTKQALQQYLGQFIAEYAVRTMYSRGDTGHIADAHLLIDEAFQQLDIEYGLIEQPRQQTNPSR